MKKFVIERDIPAVGSLEREQLRGAAQKSNDVLKDLGTGIQWVQSYVTPDKLFCIYVARDEALVRDHARISGFPATHVYEVKKVIDPTTATAA
jgi:Nickel responsive protein SCO4226-like